MITEEKITAAAKNYAEALIDLAKYNEITYDELEKDLKTALDAYNVSDDMPSVLNNPSINLEVKTDIVKSIFKGRVSDKVINFLIILVEKNRMSEFPQICRQFKMNLNEINNIQPVTVTSAIELSKEQKEQIVEKLSQKLKKTIEPSWKTDDGIIAGLMIKIYDNIIDMSVKNRINKLNKRLMLK